MQEHSRKNLQDAFVGDPDPLSEGVNSDPEAPVSVEFRIKSGLLRAQAPPETETDLVLGPDRFYEADLVLEDDTRVTIQIAEGAEGVNVAVNASPDPGLSGIESETVDA
ncbi:MAG TPA: hypothetical protein VFJ58_21115 [Armatimonadota bacterium]|nr:hypothetical protein [Armatimonadota bacterium]